MAYTFDSDTNEGRLRSLIFDTTTISSPTKEIDYQFSDAELTAILDVNSDDLHNAAADCCRALSAKYAAKAEEIGLSRRDIYISYKGRSKMYAELAKQYDGRSGLDTVEYWDSFAYDVDRFGVDNTEYSGSE
jgi:hypothetical protein